MLFREIIIRKDAETNIHGLLSSIQSFGEAQKNMKVHGLNQYTERQTPNLCPEKIFALLNATIKSGNCNSNSSSTTITTL
jgi:hypothetical protein